ncbi:glucose-1-phosphate adenylyltransferase family protein [Serinicoccus sp. CUA-874]|uniref:glucose-1-phosphate adenylyltransferase family protein n=1 Tax=Serinicoccus sp. CUA-874 TaxID=1517939 RepID=UPI001301673A|nr:sugar phosphate nucleotidyltransferase [Serinicoccus sp. CUA-874]
MAAVTSIPVDLRTLAVVQAGGQGSRMDVLTRERAKPALPFAATNALIDFPLSVLAAAGVSDVWVSVQFQSSSLDGYLAGGRPWDLDRNRGGFRRLTPEEGTGSAHEEGFSHGNADGLFRMREAIRVADPHVLIVMSADHVFNLDLRPVVAEHLAREAECTLVTAEIGVQEATQKVVVEHEADGQVTAVHAKPRSTDSGTVATEIFLYRPQPLLAELERLHAELQAAADDDRDTGLGDFGDHLLPALVRRGRVRAVPITGYWKDVGRPQAYLQAHRDLLTGRVDVFGHADRPVLGQTLPGPPGWVGEEGELVDAMVGPGSRVRGRVVRSVLGRGVQVQAGALVEDSVLLDDVLVEAGARVRTSVVDRGTRVGRDATVGACPPGTRLTDETVTLVGQDCRVRGGTTVEPGARLEPGSTT